MLILIMHASMPTCISAIYRRNLFMKPTAAGVSTIKAKTFFIHKSSYGENVSDII
jgi:hypothetical protein